MTIFSFLPFFETPSHKLPGKVFSVIKNVAFVLVVTFLLSEAIALPTFSQESSSDSLSDLLRKMQDAEADGENDEDNGEAIETAEPDEDESPVSPGAPAIHGGKNAARPNKGDEEEEVKEEDGEEEVNLDDYHDETAHDDDDGEDMLETTKPRSLTDGMSSTRPQHPRQTPEPTVLENKPKETPSVRVQGGYVAIDDSAVGCPFASQILKILQDEMMNGLNGRNAMGRYNTWRGYMQRTLANTNSQITGTEVNARARLSWYEELYRDPVAAVFKTDQFSRYMHAGLSSGNSMHLAEAMGAIRQKLDVPKREDDGLKFARVDTPEQAMQEVIRCITLAQSNYARAVSTLTPAELNRLNTQMYNSICANEVNGHTFRNNAAAVQMLTLLQKVDRRAIHDAAEALVPLSDDRLLDLLKQLNTSRYQPVSLDGQPIHQIVTSAGTILIGGAGNNTYNLDGFQGADDFVCIIDLGGNDTYREGTCTPNRPVFVIIDLDGHDNYIATKPGVQGGSLLGISMLIDCAGNDNYKASDVAQGSTIGGAGILIDKGGSDKYHALRRAQGQAFGGIGMLIDQGGDDSYHAAMWAQGFGHCAGFAVLEDVDGKDRYYLGGLYEDNYPEHPGYEGWGQGLGSGFRGAAGSACGGIGMLLDGGGDDVYEFDYIAHGGGYWLGIGMCRDFGGNDRHIASTTLGYDGNQRRQARWQRFSNGFGVHYALGFLFDDAGNDYYEGTIMGLGMGWDLSVGYLCDFGGNDSYQANNAQQARGGLLQGVGAQGSMGVLLDYFGDDNYGVGSQGYANPSVDPKYHNTAQCGGNFSFLIDYGGTDKYASGAKNNSYNTRGSQTGFLVDRRLETEPQEPPQQKPQTPPQTQTRQPQQQGQTTQQRQQTTPQTRQQPGQQQQMRQQPPRPGQPQQVRQPQPRQPQRQPQPARRY